MVRRIQGKINSIHGIRARELNLNLHKMLPTLKHGGPTMQAKPIRCPECGSPELCSTCGRGRPGDQPLTQKGLIKVMIMFGAVALVIWALVAMSRCESETRQRQDRGRQRELQQHPDSRR